MIERITSSIRAMRFFAHESVGFFCYAYRYYFSRFFRLSASCA